MRAIPNSNSLWPYHEEAADQSRPTPRDARSKMNGRSVAGSSARFSGVSKPPANGRRCRSCLQSVSSHRLSADQRSPVHVRARFIDGRTMQNRRLGLRIHGVEEERVGAALQSRVHVRQLSVADTLDDIAKPPLGEERPPVSLPRVVELGRSAVRGDRKAEAVAAPVPDESTEPDWVDALVHLRQTQAQLKLSRRRQSADLQAIGHLAVSSCAVTSTHEVGGVALFTSCPNARDERGLGRAETARLRRSRHGQRAHAFSDAASPAIWAASREDALAKSGRPDAETSFGARPEHSPRPASAQTRSRRPMRSWTRRGAAK